MEKEKIEGKKVLVPEAFLGETRSHFGDGPGWMCVFLFQIGCPQSPFFGLLD